MRAPLQSRSDPDAVQIKSASMARLVDNRPTAVAQRKLGEMIDNSPRVLQQRALGDAVRGGPIVQRVVEGYKPGTLAKTTKVMNGLTGKQRKYVQELHNEEDEIYTVEDARAEAIEHRNSGDDDDSEMEEETSDPADAPNPYTWEVLKKAAFTSADASIQSVVSNFGHPTRAVTAVYQTLGQRIAAAVKSKPNVLLDQDLVNEVYQVLDAQLPLHFGANPFLSGAWQKNLSDYSGSKEGTALYGVMRTKLTHDFREVHGGGSSVDFSDVLHAVSGRPPEAHHFLFKAIFGEHATRDINLGLTERSPRESEFGPGQHELMHYVASGANANKFKVLTMQFVHIYNEWVKDRFKEQLLAPIAKST